MLTTIRNFSSCIEILRIKDIFNFIQTNIRHTRTVCSLDTMPEVAIAILMPAPDDLANGANPLRALRNGFISKQKTAILKVSIHEVNFIMKSGGFSLFGEQGRQMPPLQGFGMFNFFLLILLYTSLEIIKLIHKMYTLFFIEKFQIKLRYFIRIFQVFDKMFVLFYS